MITRVTTGTLVRSAQNNLQSSMAALARLQEQGVSLKKISKPSDDPTGTANAILVRASQQANAQYGRNIDDGLGWVTTVDSTLSGVGDLLLKVRDLTVRGANDGALSPVAKEAIAVELDSLRSELLGLANTTYLGRTVFAGTSDAGVAFNPDYSYTGSATGSVNRRVDASTTVRVDADGQATFGSDAASAFALIDNIAADLRSGTNIGPRLIEIDSRITAVNDQRSTVGTHHAQLLRAGELNMDATVSLEAQRAGIEDVELSKIILDLKSQEIAYQSALAITARVLQPTLMDFLR